MDLGFFFVCCLAYSLILEVEQNLLTYVEHILKLADKMSKKQKKDKNQRLSYYGFDVLFSIICCNAGYDGYYFADIESVWEDAGEEICVFNTDIFTNLLSDAVLCKK